MNLVLLKIHIGITKHLSICNIYYAKAESNYEFSLKCVFLTCTTKRTHVFPYVNPRHVIVFCYVRYFYVDARTGPDGGTAWDEPRDERRYSHLIPKIIYVRLSKF